MFVFTDRGFPTRPDALATGRQRPRDSLHDARSVLPRGRWPARPVLLAGNLPNGTKPQSQRLVGVLKDGTGGNGSLIPTNPANQPTPSCRPGIVGLASRAHKSVRPTQSRQIREVLLTGGDELLLGLGRIVLKRLARWADSDTADRWMARPAPRARKAGRFPAMPTPNSRRS